MDETKKENLNYLLPMIAASLSAIFIGVMCYMCGCCGPGGMFQDPGERLARRMRDELEEKDVENFQVGSISKTQSEKK